MNLFWYVSQDKVHLLNVRGSSWLDTLSATAKLGLGPLPVSIQGSATFKRPTDSSILKELEGLRRKLQTGNEVRSTASVLEGAPSPFFSYAGPSARLIEGSTFWTAALDGETAVLLVGSASNASGGRAVQAGEVISPSVNPLGAVTTLSASSQPSTPDAMAASALTYAWDAVMHESKQMLSWTSLPVTRGIVVYAGWQDASQSLLRSRDYSNEISKVIVGSPIFVEQYDPGDVGAG